VDFSGGDVDNDEMDGSEWRDRGRAPLAPIPTDREPDFRCAESEGIMAGKLLVLDEAARHLGVTPDELHRLVDRKELFPVRDGATLKFKIDDLDRFAAARGEKAEGSGLSLDSGLNLGGPAADSDAGSGVIGGGSSGLSFDAPDAAAADQSGAGKADSLLISGSGSLAGEFDLELASDVAAQQNVAGAGSPPADQDELAQTMLGTGAEIAGLEAMELDIDSLVGLSAPSLSKAAPPAGSGTPAAGGTATDSGTLNVDLSVVGSQPSNATGSNVTGSLINGSGVDSADSSGSLPSAGSNLSSALDSGLSLEDDDAAVSGIDMGPFDDGAADVEAVSALGGDEFDMVGLGEDDDTGSVVAVEPESGDSSFFATAGGESSEFTGDIPLGPAGDAGAGVGDGDGGLEVVRDTTFSGWQIAGLVCCTLLLLTAGFVMFDLMRTIGSPGDLSLSSPLLGSLASVFGWR